MSIYKRGRVWHYDFQINGRRHWGSTKLKNKRDAERFVEKLRVDLRARKEGVGNETRTLGQVIELYEAERLPALKSDTVVSVHKRLIKEFGSDVLFHEVTAADVNRMVSRYAARGVPANSIRLDVSRYTALRNWVANHHPYIQGPPTAAIERPKATRKVRILNSDEEERLLFEALNTETSARGLYLATILLDTGLRYSELTSLPWSGVFIETKRLMVYRSKTDTVSSIPLPDRSAAVFEEIRREVPRSCPWVFPGGDPSKHMTRQCKALESAIRESGLNADHLVQRYGKFTPHSFRHTYATRLIRAGIYASVVQKLMGHTDIKTTMIYVHLAAEDGFDETREALNALNEGRTNATSSPDSYPNVQQIYKLASG